ncbi:VOC family protein [Caulobacter mirabilis]|uniref:Bleomycin resistance family protein n=1 Tax=Caulobacter mirabilis TaxID=69666 RepID=A0A2D2AVW6_9CAUL|nr:VOC family protein [Caulobacter mirabilis]ATQ42115.1 bleomycin resistance family protein [Caulobacter mirabilis]
MPFPPTCPEVPVRSLSDALACYRDRLGFTVDWSDDDLGLAGVSQGDSRLFLADAGYRADQGNAAPVVLWINASDRDEVDAIHARWRSAGAIILAAPEAKPWKLYEFTAQDPDGNRLRVFYDFGWEEAAGPEDGAQTEATP